MYIIVPIQMLKITSSQVRQFSGIVGLLYQNQQWAPENVEELVKIWLWQQKQDKKIELCIGLSNDKLIYTGGGIIVEPTVKVYGEIVSRHEGISDELILVALFELFTFLKKNLQQDSVRFNYQGFHEHISYRIG
jgi:hypothetical protein